MAKRWYVVHAYSGYEKKVMHALNERISLSGMEDYFDEVLVPTEEILEMRGGQKRKSERKFFPGYVLVHMDLNDDTWHLVKETPRVMGFIGGTAEKPAPITDKEANKILLNRLKKDKMLFSKIKASKAFNELEESIKAQEEYDAVEAENNLKLLEAE